jgi:O-antigen ligase
LTRPSVAAAPATRVLDLSLAAAIFAIALQLVPVPAALRASIAPAAVAFDRTARVGAGLAPARSAALSVMPDRTASALVLGLLILLIFWSAREHFGRRGLRQTVRGLAFVGLVVAPLGIAQHATEPALLYWQWQPAAANALPYTPFVNRNDFAAWLAMAIPLTLGYLAARITARRLDDQPIDVEAAVDETGVLLVLSIVVMIAAVLGSLSRSAFGGLTAGLLILVAVARGRGSRGASARLAATLVVLFAVAAMFVDAGMLAARMRAAISEGLAGRLAIWRQTWPMVHDFWPIGSGAGTYQDVMVLYQTSSRLFYISHADNEYLQILAEGGALLAVPVALALIAGTHAIIRALRADRTPIVWIRAGAAAGIVAVAVQNLFEMTLRVPANAIMLAVLAAIATHAGRQSH